MGEGMTLWVVEEKNLVKRDFLMREMSKSLVPGLPINV